MEEDKVEIGPPLTPHASMEVTSLKIMKPKPVVVDDGRIAIPLGTYYMHEMKLAVDNDPRADPEMAKQFKTHIVQLHQNLYEVLEAQSSEKPLAIPTKPVLRPGLGTIP